MDIKLKVVGDWPILAGKKFEILRDGEMVGTFGKGRDGRWNAQMIRKLDERWSPANITAYAHSSYHAMVRLIACYLLGDMERVKYLARGIWTNPCPVAEVI